MTLAALLLLAITVQGRVTAANGQTCLQVGTINPAASAIELQYGTGGSQIAYPRPWTYAPGDCFPVAATQSRTQVRECIETPSLGCGAWVMEPDFTPAPKVPETLPPRVLPPAGYPVSVRTVRHDDPPNQQALNLELLTDLGIEDRSSVEWCWTTDLTFTATSAFCQIIKPSAGGPQIFYQSVCPLGSAPPSRIWFKFCRSTLTPPPDGSNDCASVPWTGESALSCCGIALPGGCNSDIWPTVSVTECPKMPPVSP